MKIPYRNLSVRAHLFVLVLSVFLPAAGIFTWHVFQELEATRKTAYDSVKALADETAANLGRVLGNSEAVLGRLAARPLVRAIDAKNCDPILRDYVSLHPEFGTLALRDARANIICTLIPNPPAAEEVRETTWFREGMRSGKFTVGDASLSRRVGRWASISAFPVHSEGEQVVGFIFASLDLLKLNQQTFPPVSGEAVIAVIDRQDRFLLRSIDPEKWIGQSIPKHEATQVRGQREGYFTGSGADGGSQRLYAFVTVPGTGWRVLAGLPEAEALAASRARLSRSIAIGLAVLVLVLVLAYWIGSTIVNPVRHLARTAEKVSRGDINARARAAGPTEVRAVARQFNRMLDVRGRARVERDQLEAQVRESQKMEALGTLAGGIAHDFNNIIATIMGNLAIARQDVGPAHGALEAMDEIGKASLRAKNLVQQILAFGRRQGLTRAVTSLAPVVEESARLLRATLLGGVTLNVDCAADAPAVLVDATQIQQVLLNLCSNAGQAMRGQERPGIIEIRLRAHRVHETPYRGRERRSRGERAVLRPGNYVCLTVSDNGPGMTEATRSRIFEPFFTTKPVGEGTGLGLAVVYGIAQAHEAPIEAHSEPGKGTTFRIYFPALDAAIDTALDTTIDAAAPAAAEHLPAPVGENTGDTLVLQGTGKHILYVDDDEAIVFLMTRLLERQGYRVSGYTDQREALAAVRADPGQFDLAVTDYNMPGMSGLDLAQALREIRADLPVAVASGYITDELRDQAPVAGVRELIFKPDTVDDLCEAVARLAQASGTPAS